MPTVDEKVEITGVELIGDSIMITEDIYDVDENIIISGRNLEIPISQLIGDDIETEVVSIIRADLESFLAEEAENERRMDLKNRIEELKGNKYRLAP